MRVRDHKKEYSRRKQLMIERQVGIKEEPRSHFKAASAALTAVLTGYRQSVDEWTDDVERANECMRMALKKNDEVFEISKVLTKKYYFLSKKRAESNG